MSQELTMLPRAKLKVLSCIFFQPHVMNNFAISLTQTIHGSLFFDASGIKKHLTSSKKKHREKGWNVCRKDAQTADLKFIDTIPPLGKKEPLAREEHSSAIFKRIKFFRIISF